MSTYNTSQVNSNSLEKSQYKLKIVWKNVVIFTVLHLFALYGFYVYFKAPRVATTIWVYFLSLGSTQGIGAGVHRLWAHRSYKAKLPLRLYLAFFFTLSFQNDIYEWCRDHRVHHKFVDTNADPHNINRGMFFAHMGWLMVKKHPDVIAKGKLLDLSDLEQDPIVRFQRKYYKILVLFCCFLIPAFVPWYFWNESLSISFFLCSVARYIGSLHTTWLVNSYAHVYGDRPYDKNTKATNTKFVSHVTGGEGFHNYHHTFPWDYKAAELGTYFGNASTVLIDLMAKIGWAYDLKTVSKEMIKRQQQKYGENVNN